MAKTKSIVVRGTKISIIEIEEKDFISLTDMVKGFEEGSVLIEKWLRNKNTIEFIGIWEQINNPYFNSPEFGGIKNEAGEQLVILSNLESINAVLVHQEMPQSERLQQLNAIAITQMTSLLGYTNLKKLK